MSPLSGHTLQFVRKDWVSLESTRSQDNIFCLISVAWSLSSLILGHKINVHFLQILISTISCRDIFGSSDTLPTTSTYHEKFSTNKILKLFTSPQVPGRVQFSVTWLNENTSHEHIIILTSDYATQHYTSVSSSQHTPASLS